MHIDHNNYKAIAGNFRVLVIIYGIYFPIGK